MFFPSKINKSVFWEYKTLIFQYIDLKKNVF